MTDERIAVIDVETTGLSAARGDRVVEIAVVLIAPTGEVLAEYDTLVNPMRDLGATHIHRITARDVVRAPRFADVAGDVLELLKGASVVAGHNVQFDRSFLVREFERLGHALPDLTTLCTCRQYRRASLAACCRELGIAFDGLPHRALTDARVTARIVAWLCARQPSLPALFSQSGLAWPDVAPLGTPVFRREEAAQAELSPPHFVRRLTQRVHADVEGEVTHQIAYQALLARVLEDRVVDPAEEELLVAAATRWQLSPRQVEAAHAQYLHHAAAVAVASGAVSEASRRDLQLIARLLGQDVLMLDKILETASANVASLVPPPMLAAEPPAMGTDLRGRRVCFTGDLVTTIGGEPISRTLAHSLAERAGLTVASSVTKKLDLLVVADPHTQSTKAQKARQYGIRILSDAVFWQMAGIAVD